MTTKDIEKALFNFFDYRRNLVIYNITELSTLVRFETDILSLSNAGYATGVEIKISKSDLKNDLKKNQWARAMGLKGHIYKKMSPDKWLEFYFEPYKYFYYAVPYNLVQDTIKQVPEWCGIMSVYKNKDNPAVVSIIRKPKIIGNKKWSEKDKFKLARLGLLRIYNLRFR